MPERQPPQITHDTPIGPDVDLDRDDIRLANGSRLTETVAGRIVEQTRRAAGQLGPRGDRSSDRPDLTPLRVLAREFRRELARDLRELRLRDRLAVVLRYLARVIERPRVR